MNVDWSDVIGVGVVILLLVGTYVGLYTAGIGLTKNNRNARRERNSRREYRAPERD